MSISEMVWNAMGELHGTNGVDEVFQESILNCFNKHDLLETSDLSWNGMIQYGILNDTEHDPWYKEPNEGWIEYNPVESINITIYEPCNYVSNIAYYDTMLYVDTLNTYNVYMENYIKIFHYLAPGSSFLHASSTMLGSIMDTTPITLSVLNMIQYSLSEIPWDDTLHGIGTQVQIHEQLYLYDTIIYSPVTYWLNNITDFKSSLPNEYLMFGTLATVVSDLVFPETFIFILQQVLMQILKESDVDFLFNEYLPKFRSLHIQIRGDDKIKLGNTLISALIKMSFAFYWQEELFLGDHLYDPDLIATGGNIIDDINIFADTIQHIDPYNTIPYPNATMCQTTQPHSIWHRESSYGLMDLVSISHQMNSIITINQTDNTPVSYGIVICLIENECFNIDSIVNCVQKIPFINPDPPCADKIDPLSFVPCVRSCNSLDVQNLLCFIDCLDTFTNLAFS